MREHINVVKEAFEQQPVTWEQTGKEHWSCEKHFDGHIIVCAFERHSRHDNHWSFSFGSKKVSERQYPAKYEPTGSGNRGKNMKILGYVVSVIRAFMDRAEPDAITFTGNRANGLAALYTAMAKYLDPQIDELGYRIVQPKPGEFLIQYKEYEPGQTIGIY